MKELRSFPLSIVKDVSNCYNKAFHAKIFTLFASSQSEVFTFAKEHTPHYNFCFAFMEEDEGQWFLDPHGIARVRQWVLDQAQEDASTVFNLHKSWQERWEQYTQLCDTLDKRDLSNLDATQLYTMFAHFYNIFLSVGSIAYIADSFMSTGTEDWLESLIKEELGDQSVNDNKIAIIRELTSPVHMSFALEAEYSLLTIGLEAQERFGTLPSYEVFSQDKLFALLQEHTRNYYWIHNNYFTVKHITDKDFYNDLLELVSQGDLSGQLRRRDDALSQIRTRRDELLKTLHFSPFSQNVLDIARLFTKWKDVRKAGVYKGMHQFDRFLAAAGKLSGYTKEELTFAVFPEMRSLLLEHVDMHEELARRKQCCFFALTPEGYYITSDADTYFACRSVDVGDVITLRGVVASPGYSRGRVRIIRNAQDMESFLAGEILVANQTTPEFVPIMKKAAAIVTEQGGITSHAAVVSRELGKPCIIGTKIATSVLKTGEVVEVDGASGQIHRQR